MIENTDNQNLQNTINEQQTFMTQQTVQPSELSEPQFREPHFPQKVEQRTGFHVFYLFPLLYVLSAYASLIVNADNLWILSVLFGIVNIVTAIVFCKPQNRLMLLNASVLIKYAMIPYFVFGGIVIAIATFYSFMPVPFIMFAGASIVVIAAVWGWIVLALGAPYVISYLRLAGKERLYPKILTVIFGILQFFFVADVIAVIVLTFRECKWRKLTITLIIISVLFVFALLLWGVLKIVGAIL